jgi:hypothetical protein
MIDGLSGHLLPGSFVATCLNASSTPSLDPAFHRRIARLNSTVRQLGPASSLRAMVDVAVLPLLAILEIDLIDAVSFRIDHALCRCRAANTLVLVMVAHWGARLDPLWRVAAAEATAAGATWCLLSNGKRLRLFPTSRLYSRRAVDLDLEAATDDPSTAAALRMIFGAEALGGSGSSSLSALIAAAEAHQTAVCRSLRAGVLDASRHVLGALAARERSRPVEDVFEQSLTIVYRLLFLLFAEARGLVPLWHPVYRESYSIDALREAALKREAVGLWDAMRASSRLAHAGCSAGSLKVTAFNGRLFSPARTPLAERRNLDDQAARRTIIALSTRPAADGEGLERISYRELGVEQLGAVYETLLDYVPRIERSGRGRRPEVALEPGSGVRKDTGTFYTPQSLVEHLVRDTLAPLVAGAAPERILALRVLDPSMGSGAFLVGACQYLAQAYERALVDAGRCHPSDVGASERASMRRLIAERCLFGVDINPTAVQLARLSLWLTTLAADKPLTFLDHRLRVGDSLAGTWMSLLRTAPARKQAARELPLFAEDAASDAARFALPVRFRLASDPNDTAAQVRDKERALADLTLPTTPLGKWTRVADAWCAAWLADPPVPASAFAALAESILSGRSSLPAGLERDLSDRVHATAASRRLFHWELEYPEVFFDEKGQRRPDGGFDAVLGNPPWDMVRADTHGDRQAARAEAASLVRFARDSGVYVARADGHVNRYQLFLERAIALTRPTGRIGLVLPSGLLADGGSTAVRRLLFSRCAVERIVGFDNRRATFPIHRSVRFVLLSARVGEPTTQIACRFGEADATALDRAATSAGTTDPSWFPIRVTRPLLEKLSGDELSIPDLRTPMDIRIAEQACELFSPLGAATGWSVHFGRELNATEDRRLFRTDRCGLPVLEGKSIESFRVAADRARWTIAEHDAVRALGGAVRRSRLAYRDVAGSTNRLTLIAAILPPQSVSTHTLFCLKEPIPLARQHLLCALLNSLVVNFLVRLRVSTHVTTAIVERLPVPCADETSDFADELMERARLLAVADDAASFVRLNAVVARIYALQRDQFEHILARFPLVDAGQRRAMLDQFRRT